MNSATFKKLSELFFSELQLADIQPHRAARDCLISVWFVEGYYRRVSINIYEISSCPALLVLRRPIAKFFSYTYQLSPFEVSWELYHFC